MRIYEGSGWVCWGIGAVGGVAWLIAGVPGAALASALAGVAAGVVFFALGEIVDHLGAIRVSLSQNQPEFKHVSKASPDLAELLATPSEQSLEERSANLQKSLEEAMARRAKS